jgi:hypothetical protein
MAIQTRRGNESDFDPNKLLPGEWAGTTDTKKTFYAYGPGDTKRMATYEDMQQNIINATEDVKNQFVLGVNQAISDSEAVTSNCIAVTNDAKQYAEQFKTATDQALLSKRYAIGGVVDGDTVDNSKYYKEQAANYAAMAQEASGIVIPTFYIDFTTGELTSVGGNDKIKFSINADGYLESEVML